jgi:DNA-binding FadR family transcriptional regulator
MTRKTLFRRLYDAIIEGRRAQAQRHIEEYLRAATDGPNKRKD